MKESYYLFSNGTLSKKNNTLRLVKSTGETIDLKIAVVRDLYLFGEISLNTRCINYIGKLNIPIHFFNYYGIYTGSFYPKEAYLSGETIINQVKSHIDEEKRLKIAKEFLNGASYNILRNLKYYNSRNKNLEETISEITILKNQLNNCRSINGLMGKEGNIRKLYYNAWNKIFNKDVDFSNRIKRPPTDMINSLISYLNSLLYSVTISEIYNTKLNPTISFLHTPSERRFSLSLDISEVFKPLIVDRMIFSLINKNIISEKDFLYENNLCYLKEDSRKKVLKEFDLRLKKTIKFKPLNREISYRYLIKLECYNLIKELNNEAEYSSFKIWW